MKKRMNLNLLVCAALLAGFTSCSNDSETVDSEIVPNGKPTVARITLTQEAFSTRDATANKIPTADEMKINSATLYIFNATNTFVKQVDFDDVLNTPVTQTVELTTGTHTFYALVNYPGTAPVIDTDNGAPSLTTVMSQVENEIALTDITKITKDKSGFLMSTRRNATKVVLKEADENNSNLNAITLHVGRAMAKLITSYEAKEQSTFGTLGSVKYQGINNPNKMYALPNIINTEFLTPYFYEGTVDQTRYFPELVNDFSMTGWVDADGDEANAIYLVENSNESPKVGNSTCVLLKGVFAPIEAYCYSGADGKSLAAAIAPGTSFWCATTDDGKNVFKQRFFDSAPTAAVLSDLSTETKVPYTKSIEYRNGEAYYPFFIKDESQSTRTGMYTTARNNYYGVTITAVRSLGSNTPAGVFPDPEIPLGAEAWIDGKIEIYNWNVILQSGEI